ncbi:cellulase family glycosylhydrolase [Candidatus Nomurabacteria bacterium]|nr:cellulase family glycosylhydrolase [Candidatus Nomurabacteria bacterium]
MKRMARLEWYLMLLIFLLGSFYLLLFLSNADKEQKMYDSLNYTGQKGLVHVRGGEIFDEKGKRLHITGMNLGSWLMFEGYMWGMGNQGGQDYSVTLSDMEFRDRLDLALSDSPLDRNAFLQLYRDNFITPKDFQYLQELGVNLVRIPFSAKDFSEFFDYGRVRNSNFEYLDRSLVFCEQYKIYCVLDLHVPFKPQNTFIHSDSNQTDATFWEDKAAQEHTILLWKILAQRYSGNPYLAGFDLLNEPQAPNSKVLKDWYIKSVAELRALGFQHLIFLQPNNVSLDIESVLVEDEGIVYAPHYYGYGTKAREETELLFQQKEHYDVPVVIGEVGNWANDWWAKHTDIFVLYRFLNSDIPVIYWPYKDMIQDNKKSFGLVSGDVNATFDHFSYALQNGVVLPYDFDWNTLAQSFKTKFPTDRPLVENIIKHLQPEAPVRVYETQSQVREVVEGKDTDLFGYHPGYTSYLWDLSQEFSQCIGKSVGECFGMDQ